jgi:hypothetical protein
MNRPYCNLFALTLNFTTKFCVISIGDEPPDFPVDMEYLNEIRKRVSLARIIDKEEHKYV